ncbi:hypothetical protein EVAR_14515_1 [Eumeta japonica]|uniref:Uncharacterized protein n=1 Tax=Eumeta variegata TaxID=151549 RepID=A0A4C1U3D5_EUMVA|nr:hypothetical protein EVAR_14515_1 [Eumeta japonica]
MSSAVAVRLEFRRPASPSISPFSPLSCHYLSIRYAISTQEAGNAPVTPLSGMCGRVVVLKDDLAARTLIAKHSGQEYATLAVCLMVVKRGPSVGLRLMGWLAHCCRLSLLSDSLLLSGAAESDVVAPP